MADATQARSEPEAAAAEDVAAFSDRSMVFRSKLSLADFGSISSFFRRAQPDDPVNVLKDCLEDTWRCLDDTLRGYVQHRHCHAALNLSNLRPSVRDPLQTLQARVIEIGQCIAPGLEPSAWSTIRICATYTGDKLRPSKIVYRNVEGADAITRILLPLATIPIDIKRASLRAIDAKTDLFHHFDKQRTPSSRSATATTPTGTAQPEAATAAQQEQQHSGGGDSDDEHSGCESENFDDEDDEAFEKEVANRVPLDRLDEGHCSVGVVNGSGLEQEVMLSRGRVLCVGGNLGFVLRARPCVTTFFLTCTLHSRSSTPSPFTRDPVELRMATPSMLQAHLRAGANTFTMERMRRSQQDMRTDNVLVEFAPGKWCRKRTLVCATKDSRAEPDRKLG